MSYAIPDLHIKIEKKNQYEFYINKNIFELNENEAECFKGNILLDINTKYNKFLFKINFENKKAVIYCNTDYIQKSKYNEIINESTSKIISKNKKDICYISERHTKSSNKDNIGNWYLIKMDNEDGNEINCIIKKIQNEENEFEQIDKKNNYKENINNYDNIQYDIESID